MQCILDLQVKVTLMTVLMHIDTLIIHVEEEKSKAIRVILRNGQKYTGEELFDKFLMFRNDSWRSFGVPKDEREYKYFN